MFEPTTGEIATQIACLSGHLVLMEQDLARIYGITARHLRELVQRHPGFFPGEFCFTPESSELYREGHPPGPMRDAFTCEGALMAAALLHSPEQLARSVQVAAAFEALEHERRQGGRSVPRASGHNRFSSDAPAPAEPEQFSPNRKTCFAPDGKKP